MAEDTAAQSIHSEMTSAIVGAYVAHNHVALAEMPALIRSVHDTLAGLDKVALAETPAEPPKPAVPIKKSITDDYIISLEDGRKFKSMKRYLAGLGMRPADYRAKWGLPNDYPMVAPVYAKTRSELAKSSGLGRKGLESVPTAPEPAPAPEPEPAAGAPGPKRGRAKKAT